jgi:hypothetical protein
MHSHNSSVSFSGDISPKFCFEGASQDGGEARSTLVKGELIDCVLRYLTEGLRYEYLMVQSWRYCYVAADVQVYRLEN